MRSSNNFDIDGYPRAIESSIDVTNEQIAFFKENGYLSIPRITTDEEVECLKGIYNKLFTEPGLAIPAMTRYTTWLNNIYDGVSIEDSSEVQGRSSDLTESHAQNGREMLTQVLSPEAQFPELRETIYFQNAQRIAAKLLDVEIENISGGGHMIQKPAYCGSETPWHQDEAYWDPEILPHSLSVWLPLDPATIESGCLQFIPKSHKGQVHWHRYVNNDPLRHGLVTDDVDTSQAVACPIPVGGVTFHHCRTLHYSAPNITAQARRAYILVFSDSPKKQNIPKQRPWQVTEQIPSTEPKVPVVTRS